ncbi:MAG: DsbA family protein [Solirubrobacteraceae bacterium]
MSEPRDTAGATGGAVGVNLSARPPAQPIFYYDLGSPACYLVAERIMSELPVAPEWEPVLGTQIGGTVRDLDRARLELLGAEQGLQALRWPSRWPPESRTAMLAATYAKRVGRAVAFSLAAYRQAFAGARDLDDRDTVLIAAAACEIHPAALLKGIGLRSVAARLERAGARALEAGVRSLPAITVDGLLFEGDGGLERAASALGARR